MTRALPWVALAVGIVLALGVAVAAYQTTDYAWSQVVDYESPFVDADLPPAAAGPPQSERVVFVLIDGMGDAISREMTAVQNLREYGADFLVETPQPSLSYPTWTTLLSGAPHSVHGVTTNWFEGRVPVETFIDTALAAKRKVVVVGGSESLDELYGVSRADGVFLQDWEEGDYLGEMLVDETLRLAGEIDPDLVFLYIPDLDEAGHDYGPESAEYADVADLINTDLTRLVDTLEDGMTTFVVVADHGHIDGGGHGGWEEEAIMPPAVFAGGAVALAEGEAQQSDVAPTVAALAGIPVPRNATGSILESVVPTLAPETLRPARAQRATALAAYMETVSGVRLTPNEFATFLRLEPSAQDADVEQVVESRLAADRDDRIGLAAAVAGGALFVLLIIGVASWRALVAALSGTVVYQAVYNLLFFVLHGHRWSLSAFNEESLIDAFFYTRMGEAVAAGLLGAFVAGMVYVALRNNPKGSRGEFLPGWLALGVATVLAIQASQAIQVAWYLWAWGADVVWNIPDLMWGFKFDLDLVQMAALGAAALLAPVVTLLVGRYHPRVRVAPVRRRRTRTADDTEE